MRRMERSACRNDETNSGCLILLRELPQLELSIRLEFWEMICRDSVQAFVYRAHQVIFTIAMQQGKTFLTPDDLRPQLFRMIGVILKFLLKQRKELIIGANKFLAVS